MALLFMDSFDNYATPAIGALGKWQTLVLSGGAPTLSIAAGFGRNGTAALKAVCGTAGVPTYLQGVLSGPLTRIVYGFAINVTTFEATHETPFLAFLDTNVGQVYVTFLPNGQIRFRSGSPTGTILATTNASVLTATGVYFYLEFDITFNSATGALALHVNGVNAPLSTSSGLNTAPSGNNNFNTHQLGYPTSVTVPSSSVFYVDDLYMVSTAGGSNTTFLGDVRVVCVFPNGPGASTQFTPNGAATNWQCVSEVSEDAGTTFVSDANVGDEDLYTKGSIPVNTGQIFGIQLCAVAQKDAASGRSLANITLSGATTTPGATHALGLSYAWFLDIQEQDPNVAAPWTFTTFQAAQIGVKVAA
jgi:hypothetical protein